MVGNNFLKICLSAFLFILFFSLTGNSQERTGPSKYWIEFTDKNDSPYSISNPEAFLSEKAINRRASHGIQITIADIPVNQNYIDSIKKFGVTVKSKSKWMNGITIECADNLILEQISSISFVKNASKVQKFKSELHEESPAIPAFETIAGSSKSVFDYGYSEKLITMVNGHYLHNQGYLGQGVDIAIIDAGFIRADTMASFDSVMLQNHLLGTWDFVLGQEGVYNYHNHGTSVFSIMAGNVPGQYLGSAPRANYLLLRSEDASTEYPVEEDYWISAAEFADSAGVQVINTSLGYDNFDDATLNHVYSNLDGKTYRISRAVNMAASRGILVVVSAGNSGDDSWHYITVPADADSALTVGAVTDAGTYASFSSTGPSADGDVKPNVVGQGKGTYFVATSGVVVFGNGTSFSAPLICGLTACLWQANPEVSCMEIIDAIERSATQYNNPDSLLGFGLPDFAQANFILKGIDYNDLDRESFVNVFPSPFTDELNLELYSLDSQQVYIELFNVTGEKVYNRLQPVTFTSYNIIKLTDLQNLSAGTYLLQITTSKKTYRRKILKS